ncbi:hypothetical protein F6U93_01530 [Tamlana haliotis]|uniref:Uncharacterized protein n=1 Tax=Pseudotamlana haliotis TaxID=2614804 RepID=A0A6N6MLF4_9FLAO|nr:hypothetical protein [Tamlana haliotis]KAB1071097.1 hypothetical protein F6U93_01530 [Tamlana haliotis]
MAYYSMAAFGYIREFLLINNNIIMSDDNARELAFIISPFVIAPILVFLAYKLVFNYPKSKITLLIVLFSILLLVLQSCYFFFIAKPIDDANLFLNLYTIWQVIMALALQLIFKSNKS